jgi:hypothetical protein
VNSAGPAWAISGGLLLLDSSMDALTLFGLFAVTAMLVCYALEDRSRWFVLASCGLGSAYGFLQGAWPFGLVEAIWVIVAPFAAGDRSGLAPVDRPRDLPDEGPGESHESRRLATWLALAFVQICVGHLVVLHCLRSINARSERFKDSCMQLPIVHGPSIIVVTISAFCGQSGLHGSNAR